ncbi:MAG TPA: DUF6541 family protein, partial [Chloroflexia bacterium]|nr:DUF6541 family protein [Chloroflexia bacterium]
NDASTGDLSSPLVGQSFRSPRANLSRIELLLKSYSGLPADVQVKLLEGDGLGGRPLFQSPLTSAEFRNPYLSFSFPPLSASEGATYTLVLEAPGRPLSSALGIAYSSFDTLSSGQMYSTEQDPVEGDLAIAAFYHYGPDSLMGDITRTFGENTVLLASWILLLFLPGMALLSWVPNGLTNQQRVLAAPALTALIIPIFFLLARSAGLQIGSIVLWVLLAICAAVLVLRLYVRRAALKLAPPIPGDVPFWILLVGVFAVTLMTRLTSLKDAYGGMGLDAYHHTLISQMFVRAGGIPSTYEPFAPLASFTYHYGFHALVATVAWLSGLTKPTDMLPLMPQAGQVVDSLPVLTLTLFSWKLSGNRWAGLGAGILAGVVSIFPAFYVNWSRYTQGLGLALLPVSWVLFCDAVTGFAVPVPRLTLPRTQADIQSALERSGPLMLAVLGAAGLALTHYRITMLYAGFVVLYLIYTVVRRTRAHGTAQEIWTPVLRGGLVALLTLGALLPWLLNLRQNFTTRFVGKDSPEIVSYYSIQNMLGGLDLLLHPSLPLMLVLSVGGIVWAIRRRDLVPLLPAVVWLLLGLLSNPYLLPVRLPYAGYLDVTTVVTGAWLPLALLAGYSLSEVGGWLVRAGNSYDVLRRRVWLVIVPALLGIIVLVGGTASGLSLASRIDIKPYITSGDVDALVWMRDNLPRGSYVLANPFAFTWDPPPQSVHGSDAGLWVPLIAGVSSSVPPLPAYNERPFDPGYIDRLRDIIQFEPFEGQPVDWQELKDAGITHIYVGSRGGALDVASLLRSDHTTLLFHRDAAWVFALR